MAKASKRKIKAEPNEKPVKVDGTFLEVFQVVKKNKEDKAEEKKLIDLEKKVDALNEKKR